MTEGERREVEAWIRLGLLPGVGSRGLARAWRSFGTAVAALRAAPAEFAEVVGAAAARSRADPRVIREAARLVDRALRGEGEVVRIGTPGYPDRLLALHDPPPCLFLQGRRSLLHEPALVIVGSRRATRRARLLAGELAAAASREGRVVVSGLALGVDGAAHQGALDAGGRTVAVLGSGLDRPHPSSNRGLARRILGSGRGALLTEFPPGTPALPHHFPRRNRILAALGGTVVVVQAGARSGALITVDHALDLGGEVAVVVGPEGHPSWEGSTRLLREGAHPLFDPEELGPILRGEHPWAAAAEAQLGAEETDPREPGSEVAGSGRAGPEEFDPRPLAPDEIARLRNLDAPAALALLTRLELEGRVRRGLDGRFEGVGARTAGGSDAGH